MVSGTTGEWDGIIKARKAFFAAERALAQASSEYEKARQEWLAIERCNSGGALRG